VESERVFVVDFGLAKELSRDVSLSTTGWLVGTPAYMAPEQITGRTEQVDARTDVYGLGATLFACVTGRPPFAERDLSRLLRAVLEEEAPSAGIDRDLDTILLTCLAKERDARYASARELAVDLDRYLGKLPIRARPPSLVDRARKLYLRHRVATLAALAAVLITGLVLVPLVLEQRAGKEGARSALELSERVTALLDDAVSLRQTNAMGEANRQLDRGIQECEEFLREHPVPRVHHLLGRLLRARGKVAAARAAFDEALRLDPSLPGVRFERGLLLVDLDPRQAAADLAAGEQDPSLRHVDRLLGRAEQARLRGDLAQARQLLEEIRAIDPSHPQAALSLSRVAIAQGDGDAAFEYALSAVAVQRGE
jgi:serine/threonine-protein kinase